MPALPFGLCREFDDLYAISFAIRLLANLQVEVRALDGADALKSVRPKLQHLGNVPPHSRFGRRRERQERHVSQVAAEARDHAPVICAEVVAPLLDTVRLVHSDGTQAPIVTQPAQLVQDGRGFVFACVEGELWIEELGCDVDQKVLTLQCFRNLRAVCLHRPGENGDLSPDELVDLANLVLHQGNEGRDHDHGAVRGKGRELVHQGLPTARAPHHEGVPAL
mmetsp:Transcript_11251/g.33366  ORF Transcript_11251/g.33366 Transcript_11251/m.33366 type:complete len:222 (-) Transcript_11251:56-721(-)